MCQKKQLNGKACVWVGETNLSSLLFVQAVRPSTEKRAEFNIYGNEW